MLTRLADGLTAVSLLCIAAAFGYLLLTRRRDPFSWMLGVFALFMTFCAVRFIIDAALLAAPPWSYDVLCLGIAGMSLAGAAMLVLLAPKIARTPSPITDQLTGLPNRAMITARIAHALERASQRDRGSFAVVFLDLDGFKKINDSLGHEAGDELLVAVARRLEGCVRGADVVARLGGDEFLVFLDRVLDRNLAEQSAARIIAELAKPFAITGRTIVTRVSAGIAFSNRYTDERQLLRDADAAMYGAKARGGGCYEIAA